MKKFDIIEYNEDFDVLISRDGRRFYYDCQYNQYLIKPINVRGLILPNEGNLPIFLNYNMFSFGLLTYDSISNLDIFIMGI